MSRAEQGKFYAGMYAPSDAHKAAWHHWFSILSEQYLARHYALPELLFSVDDEAYTHEHLVAAQTCGYPFLKHWASSHEPMAVPVFDVPGCEVLDLNGSKPGQYRSWFVTFADNAANSIDQFQGQRLAINSEFSNSGMNVLRYAISQIRSTSPFFSQCVVSGGHRQSMQLLARKHADLAAIDVISYALFSDLEPALVKHLKIVGQSVMTMGLPFIGKKNANVDRVSLCEAMNSAVGLMDPVYRELLYLKGFEAVSCSDYNKIMDLEEKAISAGYPILC